MTTNKNVKDEALLANSSVAILAGGRSRRMGRDKAELSWGGVSWLEHTARTAIGAASRVMVVGRRRPDGWPLEEVVFLDDAVPNSGPLGGLFTALKWLRDQGQGHDRLLLLACDMPLLETGGLRWLFRAAAQRQFHHGLAVQNGERIEPLFSIYSVACLPLIEQRLASVDKNPGRFSLNAFIEAADFQSISAPPQVAATLENLNTREDLKNFSFNEGSEL